MSEGISDMLFLGDCQSVFRPALAGVAALASGVALAAMACVSMPVSEAPTPMPASVSQVDMLGPGLTRSAADLLRQSKHIATIIAARPTEVPAAMSGLAAPVGFAHGAAVTPTPMGVWWWRDGVGDFTSSSALLAHPYGPHLDLLDGILDYHEPMGYYDEVGDYYRDVVSRILLAEVVALVNAVDALGPYVELSMDDELLAEIGDNLGWEVLGTEVPLVRYWSEVHLEGDLYRLGGVVGFAITEWPNGVGYGVPFRERAQPAGLAGSLVLERVQ